MELVLGFIFAVLSILMLWVLFILAVVLLTFVVKEFLDYMEDWS